LTTDQLADPKYSFLAGIYNYSDDWRQRAAIDLQRGVIDLNGNIFGPLSARQGGGSEK